MALAPLTTEDGRARAEILDLVQFLRAEGEEFARIFAGKDCRFCCEKLVDFHRAGTSTPVYCGECQDMDAHGICGGDACEMLTRRAHERERVTPSPHEWTPQPYFNVRTVTEVGTDAVARSLVCASAIRRALTVRLYQEVTVLCSARMTTSIALSIVKASRAVDLVKHAGLGLAMKACVAVKLGMDFMVNFYDLCHDWNWHKFAKRTCRSVAGAGGAFGGGKVGVVIGGLIGGPIGAAIGAGIGAFVGGVAAEMCFDFVAGEEEDEQARLIAMALYKFDYSAADMGNPAVFNMRELRKRYHTKAKACHPDLCDIPDATERFTGLSGKFGILKSVIEAHATGIIKKKVERQHRRLMITL